LQKYAKSSYKNNNWIKNKKSHIVQIVEVKKSTTQSYCRWWRWCDNLVLNKYFSKH